MSHPSPRRALVAATLVGALGASGWLAGAAPATGASAPSTTTSSTSAGTQAVSTPGYWLVAADGGVYAYDSGNFGAARGTRLTRPVVGAAASPDGGGYWLVAGDGGIFSYGAAGFYGSTGNIALNRPIVGMAATADGKGYWLVASDGGIFSYGDAGFYGSTGRVALNRPIVGMAPTADGKGYWLVASDGGIFAFGDAGFRGSTGNIALNEPVVGMAATPDGGGYWMVARDGGIFAFGDAAFKGSTGNITLNQPVVGMAAAPGGSGYWMVARDGGMFSFGTAPYLGSTGAAPGPAPIVAMAATGRGTAYPPGAIGSDYSWPDCPSSGQSPHYPPAGQAVSVVGVDDGLSPYAAPYNSQPAFNPCFVSEAKNAGNALTVYLNVDENRQGDPHATSGPKACDASDLVCTGYNWGWNNALDSVGHVHSLGFTPTLWWLDVETPAAPWLSGAAGQRSNAAVVQGSVDALHSQGLVAGIYSTCAQWPEITGGTPCSVDSRGKLVAGTDSVEFPGLPIWIAFAPANDQQATRSYWASICGDRPHAFAGGAPELVQWIPGNGTYKTPTDPFDANYACPPPS